MLHTDPVADLIIKINNANRSKLPDVKTQTSKLKVAILKILVEEGYLKQFELYQNKTHTKGFLRIKLKYNDDKISSIHGIKQISKPGLRVYVPFEKLPRVLNGLGVAIISTSEGLMTDKIARSKKIGGEVLAYVW